MKGRLLDPRLQILGFSNNNCFSPGHCVIPLWKPTSKSEIYHACHDVHDACTAASGMHSEVLQQCFAGLDKHIVHLTSSQKRLQVQPWACQGASELGISWQSSCAH
jgi:hypothetical protein